MFNPEIKYHSYLRVEPLFKGDFKSFSIVKKYVLIVAGGIGKRIDNQLPKQFIEIAGKPILMHTFFAFQNYQNDLNYVLVLPKKYFPLWKDLVKKHQFTIKHQLVAGGKERFFSVKNGLKKVGNDSLAAIHDGVRPFISPSLIRNSFEMAQKYGNAIPAIALNDSVRIVDDISSTVFDRKKLRLIQTPQVFQAQLIKKAYTQPYKSSYTDDASVLESMGETIHLIEGSPENIKITFPSDLKIAKAMLS